MPLNDLTPAQGEYQDLGPYVEVIARAAELLTEEQVHTLLAVIRRFLPVQVERVDYGADFDLAAEVGEQIQMVKGLRQSMMQDGRLLPGTNRREIKDVITASSSLLGTLMKFHDRLVNIDRLRAIEKSIMIAMKQTDAITKQTFMVSLEREFELIN